MPKIWIHAESLVRRKFWSDENFVRRKSLFQPHLVVENMIEKRYGQVKFETKVWLTNIFGGQNCRNFDLVPKIFIPYTCYNIFCLLDIYFVTRNSRFLTFFRHKSSKIPESFNANHKYIKLELLSLSWEARELWTSRGQIMEMVF